MSDEFNSLNVAGASLPMPYTIAPIFTDEEQDFIKEALETAYQEKKDDERRASRFTAVSLKTGKIAENAPSTKAWRRAEKELAEFRAFRKIVESKLKTVLYTKGVDVQTTDAVDLGGFGDD